MKKKKKKVQNIGIGIPFLLTRIILSSLPYLIQSFIILTCLWKAVQDILFPLCSRRRWGEPSCGTSSPRGGFKKRLEFDVFFPETEEEFRTVFMYPNRNLRNDKRFDVHACMAVK